MSENICKKLLTRIGGNTPKKRGICPPYSSSPLRLLSSQNLLLFLSFLVIFFLSACQCESPTTPDDTDSGIPATNITINGGDFTNNSGASSNLTATVLPSNHTDGDIAWSSGDTNILTINSNGDYNALAPGETRITARVGDISNAVTVTVLQPATNIIINSGDFTTTNGLSGNLMATVLPPNHTDGAIAWTSSSPSSLVINSSGDYTAVGWGSAMVTATVGEFSNTINVTIKGLNVHITVTNNPTNTTSQIHHLSNHIFSNQYSAVVYYRTNTSTYTNILLSNSYNSNHMDTNVGVSSNTIVASIYFTNMTAVDGTNTTNYTRHTNDTVYLTNIFTNYRTNVVFDYYPSTNTNWANWNFIDANLSYLKMVSYSLPNANLSGANLSNANLSGANLIGVNFTNAMFTINTDVYSTNTNVSMSTNSNFTILTGAEVNFEGYHYLANLGLMDYVSRDFQKIIGSDVANSYQYGVSVSISGDYAAVSANNKEKYVYVFRKQDGIWTQTSRVEPTGGISYGSLFGHSISISENYLAVGAIGPQFNPANEAFDGVFIYERQGGGGNWQQKVYLTDSNVTTQPRDIGETNLYYESDGFGFSVSISGTYLAIGTPRDDDSGTNSGLAFIYERQAGSWNQVNKLSASDGAKLNSFGRAVSIDGDLCLVGAAGRSNKTGAVYVFQRESGGWVQTNILIANDGADGDRFGTSVSISGNRAIIGVGGDNDNGNNSGSAYIFERQGSGSWSQTAKLKADDGQAGDGFGASVSIFGEQAIVGTGLVIQGRAYLFSKEGSSWQQTRIIAADVKTNNLFQFGKNIGIHSNTAIISSRLDNERGQDAGAAYVVKFK